MRVAILGTGMVGQELGRKLAQSGHQVMMGSRTADNPKAAEFVSKAGKNASQGTFADAAAFGEVALNCTSGGASLDALRLAGSDNLAGKILIDIANPLDFSKGMPPSLSVCNTDSLGEQIQKAVPQTKVVKTLNTLNAVLMANPAAIPGDHVIFVSGNDNDAKQQVVAWLGEWFGWKPENVIDLGDITTARGAEMILPVWIRLMVALGTPVFNFNIVRAPAQTVTATDYTDLN